MFRLDMFRTAEKWDYNTAMIIKTGLWKVWTWENHLSSISWAKENHYSWSLLAGVAKRAEERGKGGETLAPVAQGAMAVGQRRYKSRRNNTVLGLAVWPLFGLMSDGRALEAVLLGLGSPLHNTIWGLWRERIKHFLTQQPFPNIQSSNKGLLIIFKRQETYFASYFPAATSNHLVKERLPRQRTTISSGMFDISQLSTVWEGNTYRPEEFDFLSHWYTQISASPSFQAFSEKICSAFKFCGMGEMNPVLQLITLFQKSQSLFPSFHLRIPPCHEWHDSS